MDEKKIINGKTKLPIGAISFFVTVLVITFGLFFYNSHLESVNSELLNKIEARTQDINDLGKDSRVQVFSLIENNKKVIEDFTKRSNITQYIKHLEAISQKYNITFEGFKLSRGNIKTSAIVESTEDTGIAFIKTRDFIKNYRQEKKSLFDLEFINSIEGMDSMKFNISFNIK